VLCGWIHTYHGAGGVWAAAVTDAGREASVPDELPNLGLRDETPECDEAFKTFMAATRAARAARAPDSGAAVAWMLPSGGW